MHRKILAAAAIALALVAAPAAWAKLLTYELGTEFGPVSLTVDTGSGEVTGTYEKYDGRIFGHLASSDTIDGIWVQPHGDHPCRTERHGTRNWGRLVFENPAGRRLDGHWGYCEEEPTESWRGHFR